MEQGLEEEIECVAISILDKPVWFTEKLYPVGKVSYMSEYNFFPFIIISEFTKIMNFHT